MLHWVFVAALGHSLVVESGDSPVVPHGFPIAAASPVAQRRLQAHGLQLVVAHGLLSTDSGVMGQGLSCLMACGIFPDQGSNPCPLFWQVEFLTAGPPGKSTVIIIVESKRKLEKLSVRRVDSILLNLLSGSSQF